MYEEGWTRPRTTSPAPSPRSTCSRRSEAALSGRWGGGGGSGGGSRGRARLLASPLAPGLCTRAPTVRIQQIRSPRVTRSVGGGRFMRPGSPWEETPPCLKREG